MPDFGGENNGTVHDDNRGGVGDNRNRGIHPWDHREADRSAFALIRGKHGTYIFVNWSILFGNLKNIFKALLPLSTLVGGIAGAIYLFEKFSNR